MLKYHFKVALACWLAMVLVLAVSGPKTARAAGGKVDTRAFNTFYSTQSGKIYDHLLKVTDYYATLAKEGNSDRIKDILALRASLSACWELFLNAGDMVYVYDLLDPACGDNAGKVAGLLQHGLVVIAGKLDKEIEWMRLIEKNVGDLPVSVELTQALKDIAEVAAYLRSAGALFASKPANETRQSVHP